MKWSGGGARLGWHSPCACPAAVLDIGGWCSRSGSHRRGCLGRSRRYTVDDIYYDDEQDEEYLAPLEGDYPAAGGTGSPRWRVLWRRIFRRKRRIFGSGAAAAVAAPRVPYDPYTYAQNFEDPGSTWMEGEDLDRSFSARFADPSRVIRSITA